MGARQPGNMNVHPCIYTSKISLLLREAGRWNQRTERHKREETTEHIQMGPEKGEQRQKDSQTGWENEKIWPKVGTEIVTDERIR